MRIAIFHDYFGAIGGGERVVLAIARILDADIITTDTDAVARMDPDARIISLGPTPGIPGLKQIVASWKFYSCNYSMHYDFFIFSGNWAHYAAHRHRPNLWYCHTPVRAFYDQYLSVIRKQNYIKRQIARVWIAVHRFFDQRSIRNVDTIVANSENIQNRIWKYYNRDSTIIFPGIDTSRFYCSGYGDYWLSVNRLYPEKRIELQIDVFRCLPDRKLLIAGGYSQGDQASAYIPQIIRDLPPNVKILGEVSEEKLLDLYAGCTAFLCTAIDEDFGITPLEAMASGKPVVAVDEGGFQETVTPLTGILVAASRDSIMEAVEKISQDPSSFREACIARAKEFDQSVFDARIVSMVPAGYSAREGSRNQQPES